MRVSKDSSSPSKGNYSLFRQVSSRDQNIFTHTEHSENRLHLLTLQLISPLFFCIEKSIESTRVLATKCKVSINHPPPDEGETLFAFPRGDE